MKAGLELRGRCGGRFHGGGRCRKSQILEPGHQTWRIYHGRVSTSGIFADQLCKATAMEATPMATRLASLSGETED